LRAIRIPVATRFALIVGGCSLATAVVLGSLFHQTSKATILDRVAATLQLTARESVEIISNTLSSARSNIDALTHSPGLLEHTERLIHTLASQAPAGDVNIQRSRVREALEPWTSADGMYKEFKVLSSKTGEIIASTAVGDVGKFRETKKYFLSGRERISFFSPVLEVRNPAPVMHVSAPIFDTGGTVIAVMVGDLNLSHIQQSIRVGLLRGKSLDIYLVDQFNYFLSAPRFRNPSIVLRRQIKTVQSTKCTDGETGFLAEKDYRGINVFAYYIWLPQHKWCLVTEIDQSEATQPLVKQLRNVLLIGAAVTVLSLILSIWAGRSMVAPIIALKTVADNYRDGQRDARVTFRRHDELGELGDSFNALANVVAERERELEESHRTLMESQMTAHLGSWIWNANTNRLQVSEEFCNIMLDGRPANLISFEEFIAPLQVNDRIRVQEQLEICIETGQPFFAQHPISAGIGEWKTIQSRGRRIESTESRSHQVAGTVFDVTEINAAYGEIDKLNQSLERKVEQRTSELSAANKELEAFTYSVSHDLRAPLRAIDGFTQALRQDYGGKLDDTADQFITFIREATEELSHLIDDLLKLSRSTRGDLQRQRTDLSAMVREVFEELRKSNPDRQVQVHIEDGLFAQVDRRLFRVVLENLIGNAWKFSRNNPKAEIRIGAVTDQYGMGFFVRDNGAGFDMAFADKLFLPFQRLHKASEFEGSGIGLSSVQRIVSRHGGTVRGESKIGEGAEFRIYLDVEGDEYDE